MLIRIKALGEVFGAGISVAIENPATAQEEIH
jgi:hypothetical protein